MRRRRQRQAGLEAAIVASEGKITVLASKLGLTVQAVSQWDEVPADRCLQVELATGVSRYDLRPDIYGPSPGNLPKSSAFAAA